ncbi:hypothetical protein FQN60_017280 [Etheostoma spectabile]|uniref:Uncharacterized protein n=1 Tax=Etheostoma spectabile TaxID=54343 RepID=A0A5J5DF24_9PERO|nr:hypothetical protein FQN60_017280 [Etheostoma spectabile]
MSQISGMLHPGLGEETRYREEDRRKQGVLQDEVVHSQLHQVPPHRLASHAAVHGVDQLGPLPAWNAIQRRYKS